MTGYQRKLFLVFTVAINSGLWLVLMGTIVLATD